MQVSPLCLGAMMFGAWGEPDHDVSIKIINRALDAGINFIDTADVYSQGESEEIVGKALAGGRRDDVILATKVHAQMGVQLGEQGDPNKRGNSRRLDHPRGREQPAQVADRLDRPVSGSSSRPSHRRRGDAWSSDGPAATGQDQSLRARRLIPRTKSSRRSGWRNDVEWVGL